MQYMSDVLPLPCPIAYYFRRSYAQGLADIIFSAGIPWEQARLSEPSEQIAMRATYVHN